MVKRKYPEISVKFPTIEELSQLNGNGAYRIRELMGKYQAQYIDHRGLWVSFSRSRKSHAYRATGIKKYISESIEWKTPVGAYNKLCEEIEADAFFNRKPNTNLHPWYGGKK